MKKALVFLVTIIAVILTLALTVSAEDVIQRGSWGELEWELNETTGALTISGEGKMNSLHGDDDAWKVYKYKIKSVSIENGVTSIGQGSFQECEYLTDIRISRTVNSIGNFAFYKCKSLSNVLIPDSVTNIGEYAFTKCASLEEVVLPNSVHSIGRNAFSDCSNLAKVTIPYGVLKIEDFTFDNCSKLTTVNLPNSISSIGNRTFRDCRLENVVLPKYINEIGEYAFDSCNFSVIEIPNSVIHIGEYAFWCNYSLKTVYIHSYTFISHMISFSTSVQDAKTIVVPKDAAVTEYILKRYTFDCDCLIDGKEYSVYSDHDHIWDSDNCLEGTTCQSCYLSVDMISHDYKDATCTEPKTCRYCEKTEGEATGHKYFNHASIDATCTNDKIQAVLCSVCQHIEPIVIEGTKLGHDFADATCTDPKTCKRDGCAVTEGNALGHDFGSPTACS